MALVIPLDWLEEHSGVIPNIMYCLYKVDPRMAYRLLNKHVYNETAMLCYNIHCDRRIVKREIDLFESHTNYYVRICMGMYKQDKNNLGIVFDYYHQLPFQRHAMMKNRIMINFHYTEKTILVEGQVNPAAFISNNVFTYDLRTLYYLCKNRGNCMVIDAQYAKKKTQRQIDIVCNYLETNPLRSYINLVYMICNCQIMDIDIKLGYTFKPLLFHHKPFNEEMTADHFIKYLSTLVPVDVESFDKEKIIIEKEMIVLKKKLIDYVERHF